MTYRSVQKSLISSNQCFEYIYILKNVLEYFIWTSKRKRSLKRWLEWNYLTTCYEFKIIQYWITNGYYSVFLNRIHARQIHLASYKFQMHIGFTIAFINWNYFSLFLFFKKYWFYIACTLFSWLSRNVIFILFIYWT